MRQLQAADVQWSHHRPVRGTFRERNTWAWMRPAGLWAYDWRAWRTWERPRPREIPRLHGSLPVWSKRARSIYGTTSQKTFAWSGRRRRSTATERERPSAAAAVAGAGPRRIAARACHPPCWSATKAAWSRTVRPIGRRREACTGPTDVPAVAAPLRRRSSAVAFDAVSLVPGRWRPPSQVVGRAIAFSTREWPRTGPWPIVRTPDARTAVAPWVSGFCHREETEVSTSVVASGREFADVRSGSRGSLVSAICCCCSCRFGRRYGRPSPAWTQIRSVRGRRCVRGHCCLHWSTSRWVVYHDSYLKCTHGKSDVTHAVKVYGLGSERYNT